MKLIGRLLSPYARRVGVALHLYGIEFEHEPISVVEDREELTKIHRLARIPCLELDDGELLVDSHQILAELDRQVGPERALLPQDPAAQRAHVPPSPISASRAIASISPAAVGPASPMTSAAVEGGAIRASTVANAVG